jgi:hypothetical protein
MNHRISAPLAWGIVAAAAWLGLSAAPASALLGDLRLVTGTVALWPDSVDGTRVAVVDGDDADRYFVRVPAYTASPLNVGPGARVAIIGHEGAAPRELTALSIQDRAALGAGRARGPWRTITGVVESASAATVTLQGPQGRVTVDMSALGPASVPVVAGDRVTVVGLTQGEGRLAARGIARDTTPR